MRSMRPGAQKGCAILALFTVAIDTRPRSASREVRIRDLFPESIAKGSSVRSPWTSYTEPGCTQVAQSQVT